MANFSHKWLMLTVLCQFVNMVVGQYSPLKKNKALDHLGSHKEVAELKKYLGRFGYVRDYTAPPAEVEHGLKQFQTFANLKVTGKLDDATMKKMSDPRCGIKDPIKLLNVTRRRKRYNHQGTTWKKEVLTWRYDTSKETRDLDRETVRQTLMKAMNKWSSKTNIEFEESNDKDADIIIQFVTWRHGDPYRFDGAGGVLAHAYYPLTNTGLSGDVHFDDAEKFTVGENNRNGKDLMWVATHELGHSLGLDHTPVEGAIMFPWYTGYKPNIDLSYDDLVGIQSLYGGKRSKPITTTTTRAPTTPTTPRKYRTLIPRKRPTTPCPKSPITAIWFLEKFNLFVFVTEDQNLYFIKENGEKRAGPIPARYYFPTNRVQGRIDAAFSHNSIRLDRKSYTVLFCGSNYYIYYRFLFISGPHSIHDGSDPLRLNLPSWVSKIDAAFTWHKNGRIYLFSGSRYWKYDVAKKRLDRGYPKYTRDNWQGVTRPVTSAFRSEKDGRTLLFAGRKVYRVNDRAVHVESGYPRNIGFDLFYCKNQYGASTRGGSAIKVDRLAAGRDP